MVVYVARYPWLHVYVAVLPITSPELSATLPLTGLLKLGHEIATEMQKLIEILILNSIPGSKNKNQR